MIITLTVQLDCNDLFQKNTRVVNYIRFCLTTGIQTIDFVHQAINFLDQDSNWVNEQEQIVASATKRTDLTKSLALKWTFRTDTLDTMKTDSTMSSDILTFQVLQWIEGLELYDNNPDLFQITKQAGYFAISKSTATIQSVATSIFEQSIDKLQFLYLVCLDTILQISQSAKKKEDVEKRKLFLKKLQLLLFLNYRYNQYNEGGKLLVKVDNIFEYLLVTIPDDEPISFGESLTKKDLDNVLLVERINENQYKLWSVKAKINTKLIIEYLKAMYSKSKEKDTSLDECTIEDDSKLKFIEKYKIPKYVEKSEKELLWLAQKTFRGIGTTKLDTEENPKGILINIVKLETGTLPISHYLTLSRFGRRNTIGRFGVGRGGTE